MQYMNFQLKEYRVWRHTQLQHKPWMDTCTRKKGINLVHYRTFNNTWSSPKSLIAFAFSSQGFQTTIYRKKNTFKMWCIQSNGLGFFNNSEKLRYIIIMPDVHEVSFVEIGGLSSMASATDHISQEREPWAQIPVATFFHRPFHLMNIIHLHGWKCWQYWVLGGWQEQPHVT